MKESLCIPGELLEQLRQGSPCFYQNTKRRTLGSAKPLLPVGLEEIQDAEARLRRFAPLLRQLFPETAESQGIIESPLTPIPEMASRLGREGESVAGRLLLKRDDLLPIAGSVKARGGVYEVLRHTEELAVMSARLRTMESYAVLRKEREMFSEHTISVGSTGNLGISIGIMSAALGYRAVVHMSADARQWKKDLLRNHGVTVVEYEGDYTSAVARGRETAKGDPRHYFVDDENSVQLFLGYGVAALRLRRQLQQMNIPVDETHPLLVAIPCGVGGAPGGITFGLRQVFGDHVHCFFVEPTEAPCMLLGMATGLHQNISVQDIGLSGRTIADGLAVGRPSGFVGKIMEPLADGFLTVTDEGLLNYVKCLYESCGILVESSAAAGFALSRVLSEGQWACPHMGNATTVVWATGGGLMPEEIRQELLKSIGH